MDGDFSMVAPEEPDIPACCHPNPDPLFRGCYDNDHRQAKDKPVHSTPYSGLFK